MNGPSIRPRRLSIITYHFPPSGAVAAFRMLGFARHLPRYGWHVGVVAPPRVPGEPMDETLLDRVPPGTAVFRAQYPESLPARIARRGLYNGVWLPRALPAVIRAVHRFQPDAVLTSGPPHCVHVVGLFLKRLYRLPWAVCMRDAWFTDYPRNMSWFPWARWEGFWKKSVFGVADCMIANTPLERDALLKAYPGYSQKITHITNGFDPEDFPPPGPLKPLNDRLTILHAGELYGGRDPRSFFDALRTLENLRPASQLPIRFRLLGQSTDPDLDVPSFIRERGLQHIVEQGGQVSYTEALTAMTRADVLLLLDTPGRKKGVPAKVFEYLGASRPILALGEADGDLAWVLRQSGIPHRIAPIRDAEKIQQALVELRDGLISGTFELPDPEQLASFTRLKLAGDLAEHLNQLHKQEQVGMVTVDKADRGAAKNALQRLHPSTPNRPHYLRA